MQRKLLTSGNVFKRTDGRWNGVVWYSDEHGAKKTQIFLRDHKAGGQREDHRIPR